MSWYDVGVWRPTLYLSAYDSAQWKDVRNCWVYDNSTWKLCYTAPASFTGFSIFDFGGGTLGAEWSYSSSFPQDWEVKIESSSDSGSSWNDEGTFAMADGETPNQVLLFGQNASDWYRASMISVADGTTQATGSPITVYPPYPT